MWKISKFLKIHEEHSSCSSHHYLHHLNDMNNNKNLHNLVQIFSNFAHICINYVLGSKTLLRPQSRLDNAVYKTAWNLLSIMKYYGSSHAMFNSETIQSSKLINFMEDRTKKEFWVFVNLNFFQCEITVQTCFLYCYFFWAHMVSVDLSAVIGIVFIKRCLLIIELKHHHSTFLA